MPDKDIMKSTFFQYFKPIISSLFCKTLKSFGVDRYVKKLTTQQLIQILVYAQLEQHRGLRDISNSLNDDDFSQFLNLSPISASQISHRLRILPSKVPQILFKQVTLLAGQQIGFNRVRRELGQINLIDSSTISLCLSQYPWATFRKTKGGVKLHLRLQFMGEMCLPKEVVITPAKPSDKTQMDALVVTDTDALNVFDRGYLDYKKFDIYCQKNIRFVTRLKSNAIIEVVKELPIKSNSLIKKDQIVYLGKAHLTKMKHALRLIEVEDTQGNPIIIITNDFNLRAEEIGDIYRYRWQIELFFKWIKQHLKVKHFYGLSPQAVENQLLIALITYCLLTLLKLKTGYKGSLLALKRLLHTCFYEPFTLFVQKLFGQRQRKSKGRRRLNHELIYQITERQVIAGEADFLNDLLYDPVIL
jgi:hypothetical protein